MKRSFVDYIEQSHHYVPRCYFKPWEHGDRKIFVYERIDGRIVSPYPQSTKRICTQLGLYAYNSSVIPEKRNVLEEAMFARIDSDAAKVLSILNSCADMTDASNDDLQAFALFLVSLRIRTPEFFQMYTQSTKRRMKKLIVDAEHDPEVIATAEVALENKARELLARDLMSGRLLNSLSKMYWSIISIPEQANISLLTSDRPFVSNWIDNGRHLLALPISPNRAIIASTNRADIDHIGNISKRRFVEIINIFTVGQAREKAFAADKNHSLRFFERRLGMKHSVLPFSTPVDPDLIDRRISEEVQSERDVILKELNRKMR